MKRDLIVYSVFAVLLIIALFVCYRAFINAGEVIGQTGK